MKKELLIGIAFLCLAQTAMALEKLPQASGFVNDYAGVIEPGSRSQLSTLLAQVKQASGTEIALVTLPSLEGGNIEDVASRLFAQWGIGQRGKDKGLLLIAAIGDRTARIEVGYGLEEAINDAFAGRVLKEILFPAFRENRYGDGLLQATQALVARLQEVYYFELQGLPPSRLESAETPRNRGPLALIFRVIFLLAMGYLFIRHPFLFLMLLSSGMGGGRRSGGFGGGFGGFGGGLSGGGGASGRW